MSSSHPRRSLSAIAPAAARAGALAPWGCAALGAAILLAATTLARADGASAVAAPPATDPPLSSPAAQEQARKLDELPPKQPPGNKIVVDHSGRKESGKASIYSDSFDGKKMANGKPFDTEGDSVASKTLPLGTVAKVTNLETGKSAEVKVEDRGPFVAGRVVDLPPKVANEIGLTEKQGVAPVVVAPIKVPQPDGSVKVGAGAAGLAPAETEEAANAPKAGQPGQGQ